MSKQLIPKGGNDCVETPYELASVIVQHFKPCGLVLEPCRGSSENGFWLALYEHVERPAWCEITEGADFFEWTAPVDWIVTNPPFSQFRRFLQHSMLVADNIVFLATVNHFHLKARVRDMQNAGFGIVEIRLFETPPKPWPQAGFQVGAVWLKRGWKGSTFIH